MSKYGTFTFESRHHRRLPDPIHRGLVRHFLFVRVGDVPKELPLDANARVPKTSKRIYRDIEKSLLEEDGSEPGTFHLKHKGITLVASRVRQRGESQFDVTVDRGQGILDGGHTYDLITRDRAQPLPEQYVKFEILTDVPEDWISDLSGGLNTSVQVQPMSLDHLHGDFDWIKEELRGEPYIEQGKIAWRENEPGDMDARDVISLLTCFNVFDFPNDRDDHPVMAYEKKSAALSLFEENQDHYKKLRPLMKDIMTLHDTILREAPDVWNPMGAEGAGGKYGKLKFVESRTAEFPLVFVGGTVKYRLMDAVLYPILAAFRWNVEADKRTGEARWRGGFDATLDLWRSMAAELLRATFSKSEDSGRSPNAIGKSRPHWSDLHRRVAMKDLMSRKRA